MLEKKKVVIVISARSIILEQIIARAAEKRCFLFSFCNNSTYRWSEVMAYLMSQSQLRYLGRHSTVVIHESYDAGVQGSLSRLIQAGHRFGISLELLTNTTGRAWRGCNPSESKGASGEVPVDKAWNNIWKPVTVNRHGVMIYVLYHSLTCKWRRRRGRSPHDSKGSADSRSYWRRCSPSRMDSVRCTVVEAYTPSRRRSGIRCSKCQSYERMLTETGTIFDERYTVTFIRWTSNLMFLCSVLPSNFVSL